MADEPVKPILTDNQKIAASTFAGLPVVAAIKSVEAIRDEWNRKTEEKEVADKISDQSILLLNIKELSEASYGKINDDGFRTGQTTPVFDTGTPKNYQR